MTQPPIIGVVGLGTMGLGIAQTFAAAGFSTRATDAQASTRAAAHPRLTAALNARVSTGKLTAQARDATLSNLAITDFGGLAPATLVIEAIIEDIAAKHALFAALETLLAPDAVLTTNTSSLSVAAIAAPLHRPDRLLGLHFFNPAPVMQLVELIAHAGTCDSALSLARNLTEATGKTVIGAPDRPGFIVNRCARPFYGEALALLEEGRSASDIDAAMLAAGYRIGPLSLIDLIGADINLAATTGLSDSLHHPRYQVFDALKSQVGGGHLGRKSGKGFLFPDLPGPPPADWADIALRIEATLINEAGWLLSEGGTTPNGIDTAMRLGLNFPHGPFAALQAHGKARILSVLHSLEIAAPPQLKLRYLPAPVLET